jgi:hypothetical protein
VTTPGRLTALPPADGSLVTPGGALVRGRFAGDVTVDPVVGARRTGRVRRWRYVAAGDGEVVVGAAVVDLGFVGVTFAFAAVGGRVACFDARRPLGRGTEVGRVPGGGAASRTRGAVVTVDGDGSFRVDVPTAAGRLRAEVTVTRAVTPAVLATDTQDGGWNVTAKSAGTTVAGAVRLGEGAPVELGDDAGGWSDWTAGRQDRRTTWRWVAGAGMSRDGRRVGVNASTGMNEAGIGEDVVWWDGVPYGWEVVRLAPVTGDPGGTWTVRGPGTDLRSHPLGVRRAHEQLPLVTSSYVQPFGAWAGVVPDPSGLPSEVALAGVAEDHLAVW